MLKINTDVRQDAPEDERSLALRLGNIEVTVSDAMLADGFYTIETDGRHDFQWFTGEGKLYFQSACEDDYLLFDIGSVCSERCVKLKLTGSRGTTEITLFPGWQPSGIRLGDIVDSKDYSVILSCDYRQESIGDSRDLSLKFSRFRLGKPNELEKNAMALQKAVFRDEIMEPLGAFYVACDTSAVCNLRCAFCCLDRDIRKHPDLPLGIDRIRDVIRHIGKYAWKLAPYLSGEPFCRNDMWEAMDLAKEGKIQYPIQEIQFSTNGLLLNDANINKVFEYGITSLLISVNAASERTYKRIQGGDFNQLVANLENLSKRIKERNYPLEVSLSYILMRENVEELPDFIRLVAKLGFRFQLWNLNANSMDLPIRKMTKDFDFYYRQQNLAYYPHLLKRKLAEADELADKLGVIRGDTPAFRFDITNLNDAPYPISINDFDKWLELNKDNVAVDLHGVKQKIDGERYRNCYYPWGSMFFLTDGTFAPCIHLLYKGGVGNILDEGIYGVWNNSTVRELRRCVMEGKVHHLCRDTQCPFI